MEEIDKLKAKIKNLEKENSALKKSVIEMKIKIEKYEEFLGVNKNV